MLREYGLEGGNVGTDHLNGAQKIRGEIDERREVLFQKGGDVRFQRPNLLY